jgi:hypothetical protein
MSPLGSLFARSGRRETEAHELPDRFREGGYAFAPAPVDGCLVVVFLESEADEDGCSISRKTGSSRVAARRREIYA